MKGKQRELHYYIYQDRVEKSKGEEDLDDILNIREQERVIQAINELPIPCNVILEEYYLNAKRTKDIIRQLGIGSTRFYNLLGKGKYLLRRRFNDSYYDAARQILLGRTG